MQKTTRTEEEEPGIVNLKVKKQGAKEGQEEKIEGCMEKQRHDGMEVVEQVGDGFEATPHQIWACLLSITT